VVGNGELEVWRFNVQDAGYMIQGAGIWSTSCCETFEKCPHSVIPTKVGIQQALKTLDSTDVSLPAPFARE